MSYRDKCEQLYIENKKLEKANEKMSRILLELLETDEDLEEWRYQMQFTIEAVIRGE